MRRVYEKLYDDCSTIETFYNDAHFVSMQGKYFSNNERKFMLIGRATNGWGSLDVLSKQDFGIDAESQFNSLKRWSWIESVNGILYSTYDREEKNLTKRYCIDKKPYWTYTKAIWEQLPGMIHSDEIWMENIAWSNLYKVSPSQSNNPDWNSQEIQRKACIEILKKELEAYKPTHILAITGYDWFKPFSILFDDVYDIGKRNILRGKNKNEVYVEGIATYETAKVVIACRPEWRDRIKFVSSVLDAFK